MPVEDRPGYSRSNASEGEGSSFTTAFTGPTVRCDPRAAVPASGGDLLWRHPFLLALERPSSLRRRRLDLSRRCWSRRRRAFASVLLVLELLLDGERLLRFDILGEPRLFLD